MVYVMGISEGFNLVMKGGSKGGGKGGGGSKGSGKGGGGKHSPMTSEAASRIQSAQAKQNAGQVEKGSFAARAQSAAAQNEAQGGK
eukprot:CAMPEP_0117733784 /NCGR_PEP_ID=MMETSP0947-20121206/270_1 /TAXON_ID=44440 /ORGANISM="Chattonella subsalsa, Strain CCMP2191" /LENGTH=85 /DNA_ID=CAMNT_0005548409 /DNA_START=99 /DNA_END=356 /DNA_ORIENTATION=+